ncbi:hypothetical protein PRZ48_003056 [Zasmidium cellare]|uniref:FAD-binding domain-containing protein n=1 Tax=Zasmidium cellare TaxID=395010 RepID=A0ABR0EVI9_ZASCE|nr:hypothetical protein PRZ48_003056 [Zasmidium cellare]
MKIIIIGAGLGGLSAAVCFARRKHQVIVLEQRPTLSPQGGGINVRPGASRVMKTWGLKPDLEKIGDPTGTFLLRNMKTGDIAMTNVAVDASDEIDYGTNRELLMKVLYQRALEAGAEVLFDCTVTETVEGPSDVRIVLKDGRRFETDLVLAADGVRSRIRSQILADVKVPIDPIVSDTTFYGVRMEADKIKARPDAKRLMDDDNVSVWQGKNAFVVSRYSSKLNSFGGLFAIKSENDMKGLWDEKGDIQFVRDFYAGSCEDLRAALEVAESCDRWRLVELPDLPRWTSKGGRIALLGDSAHSMEPNAAQGFSMIVEDIGVLEYLIERDPNPSANLPTITDTWQKIRKPRVERIKAYAKENTRAFLGEPMAHRHRQETAGNTKKSLKNVTPKMDARFTTSAFVKWALDYDAVAEAKKYVEGARPSEETKKRMTKNESASEDLLPPPKSALEAVQLGVDFDLQDFTTGLHAYVANGIVASPQQRDRSRQHLAHLLTTTCDITTSTGTTPAMQRVTNMATRITFAPFDPVDDDPKQLSALCASYLPAGLSLHMTKNKLAKIAVQNSSTDAQDVHLVMFMAGSLPVGDSDASPDQHFTAHHPQ